MNVKQFFAEDGPLSRVFKGYAPRPTQIRFAETAAKACEEPGLTAIESGPCGTGKSLGYLVSALLSGRKIVVATANNALLGQLVSKDLPLLQGVVSREFTFAQAKGARNWLCRNRVKEFETENGKLPSQLREWVFSTETGDLSTIPFEVESRILAGVSADTDLCSDCGDGRGQTCFFKKARLALKEADVVVTNYHLFLLNLELATIIGDFVLIPNMADAPVVIFDEVHELEDIARSMFSRKLTAGRFRYMSRGLNNTTLDIAAESAATQFEDAVEKTLKDKEAYAAYLKDGNNFAFLANVLEDVNQALKEWRDRYRTAQSDHEKKKAQRNGKGVARLFNDLTEILEYLGGEHHSMDNFVIGLDRTPHRGKYKTEMSFQMVNVSGALDANLWEPIFKSGCSLIMTSATIEIKGSFDFFKKQVGFSTEKYRTIEDAVESPFNFREQMTITIPNIAAPNVNREDWEADLVRTAQDAINKHKGGVLILCTSNKSVRLLKAALRNPFGKLYAQGDLSVQMLRERFKAEEDSVLIGTTSFWTGVDVPGNSLRCVLIDKMPFPNQGDPVVAFKSEIMKNFFYGYSVPHLTLRLLQGVGRLIRSTSCKGEVILCDSRLNTKSYGRTILKALPKCPVN